MLPLADSRAHQHHSFLKRQRIDPGFSTTHDSLCEHKHNIPRRYKEQQQHEAKEKKKQEEQIPVPVVVIMSTSSIGIVFSESSDDSDNDNNVRSVSLKDQLIDAIGAENLENLREILLSQEDEGGRRSVTDDDIHNALWWAAAHDGDSVEACRLLWARLSRQGKKKYFAARIAYGDDVLHEAVLCGHLEVVHLFIEEFKWNINQMNFNGRTPLCYAGDRLETARYLLENGAIVNQGGEYSPLWSAVNSNDTEVVRLLLQHGADPNLNRRPANEEGPSRQRKCRNTDTAIMHGNAEILRMLLEHGAFVGHVGYSLLHKTSLNILLSDEEKSRETKVAISRLLVEHATEDQATAAFMQVSFKFAVKQTGNEACQILLEAGIDPRRSMYCAMRAENLAICQLLVREYQADPFLQEDENDDSDDDETAAASPFLAAARLTDTSLFEYLLGVWESRFSSTGGKNGDGDYPLHVVCCDPFVSLQAIQLLVTRHADSLAVVDGEQGLLPFHFAANWGASLDVIFYLLQHCPDALQHHDVGNAAAAAALPAVVVVVYETRSSSDTTTTTTTTTTATTVESLGHNDTVGPLQKKAKTTTTR